MGCSISILTSQIKLQGVKPYLCLHRPCSQARFWRSRPWKQYNHSKAKQRNINQYIQQNNQQSATWSHSHVIWLIWQRSPADCPGHERDVSSFWVQVCFNWCYTMSEVCVIMVCSQIFISCTCEFCDPASSLIFGIYFRAWVSSHGVGLSSDICIRLCREDSSLCECPFNRRRAISLLGGQ